MTGGAADAVPQAAETLQHRFVRHREPQADRIIRPFVRQIAAISHPSETLRCGAFAGFARFMLNRECRKAWCPHLTTKKRVMPMHLCGVLAVLWRRLQVRFALVVRFK